MDQNSSQPSATNLEIFNTIANLMTDTQFVQSNTDFYLKNCQLFDESVEENKHEYKGIHEEFIVIQEQVIQSRVQQEKFTDQQFLDFISTLEQHIGVYEKVDKETIDYLFEMTDFEKFKAKMCKQKADVNRDNRNTEQIMSNANSRTKDDMAAFAVAYDVQKERQLYDKLIGEDVENEALGWKKRLEENKWTDNMIMTIWSRKEEGQANHIFKIDVKFKGYKIEEMNGFLRDPPVERLSMLVDHKKVDFKVSEDGKNEEFLRYSRLNAGPLIADRDHVCQFHATLDEDGWWFSSATPVVDARFPEVGGVVRMINHDVFKSREYEEDGVHYVHMVGFSETDMKGYIPISLLNMANANGIYKYFNSMMKELNQASAQNKLGGLQLQ